MIRDAEHLFYYKKFCKQFPTGLQVCTCTCSATRETNAPFWKSGKHYHLSKDSPQVWLLNLMRQTSIHHACMFEQQKLRNGEPPSCTGCKYGLKHEKALFCCEFNHLDVCFMRQHNVLCGFMVNVGHSLPYVANASVFLPQYYVFIQNAFISCSSFVCMMCDTEQMPCA